MHTQNESKLPFFFVLTEGNDSGRNFMILSFVTKSWGVTPRLFLSQNLSVRLILGIYVSVLGNMFQLAVSKLTQSNLQDT